MGRMHSKGKGMSSSALPYKRSAPSWLKTTPQEVRLLLALRARGCLAPTNGGCSVPSTPPPPPPPPPHPTHDPRLCLAH